MHFRGWCAFGASSGPECRMRKIFSSGAIVETSDKIAPEIEAMICSRLPGDTAKGPPAPAG
ncbi:MAG: hypothetical protein NT154_08070 [Verrucomicrobia bacterium]|nr:hypothetical protein [Verrucomicrobiota bacterium]